MQVKFQKCCQSNAFKIFRTVLPKSIIQALQSTKNNSLVPKSYSQSDIEQLGVCTVRLRHKDKIARCRFFIVPGDSPVLLGMPDLELLDVLKITCKILEGQQADRTFNPLTI